MIFDTIDKITLEANEIFSANKFNQEVNHASLIRLGELVRINHGLLVSLGVSHPKLERVRELVDHAGFGWTKLTGAGGGGCSLTLVKPGTNQQVKDSLVHRLVAEGFERYDATIGGDGVGVLWPAVVTRPTGEEEISLEVFLSAKGVDGVEELVGIKSIGKTNSWRFWQEALE